MADQGSTKRRPNFSDAEKTALVDGVTANYDELMGKFSSSLTFLRKEQLWMEILTSINAVSSTVRTVGEIKKRYQTLKTEVKRKESSNRQEMRKTGGGTSNIQAHSSFGEKLLQMIPEVVIEGINGGYDLSDSTFTFEVQHLADSERLVPIQTQVIQSTSQNSSEQNSSKEKVTSSPNPKVKTKKRGNRTNENTLYSLQQKQVSLLSMQVTEMKRIGDLLEKRNDIEQEKLEIKRKKYS